VKQNRSYIRLAAVLIFFFVIGVSINGRALLVQHASAQEKLQSNERFSLPSAVIQEQSGLAQTPSSYSGYTRITDNEEKILTQVPVEWNDIETGPWTFRGKPSGVFLAASSDLGNFYASRSQSGVLIAYSRALARTYNKTGLLGIEKGDLSRQCLHKGRFDYKNPFYSGQYDHFANCRSGAPGLLIFTTSSADQKALIMIQIAVVSEADLEAVDAIINSFQVLGNPQVDDHHDN
jgi:hypothetical protein